MPVFRCCVCGITEASHEDVFFYFVDDQAWCDVHVPRHIKKLYEGIK